jgi:hypothetical protein
MDFQGTLKVIGDAVELLSEGDLVPFERFNKARMKKMGRVSFGPIRVSVGDSIKIGKSKPRKVLNISKTSIHLGALKKSRRNSPLEGTRHLFWDEKAGVFYSRPAYGLGSDTLHKPDEVKVIG